MATRRGTNWNDELEGTWGNDTLYGYGGHDELDGEEGDDLLHGGDGNDELDGGDGNDTLYGEAGHDELDGDEGNDLLHGGAGDDKLDGDGGNDTLVGGTGDDVLEGGWGNDVFVFNRGDGRDVLYMDDAEDGAGTDTLSFGAGIKQADLSFSKTGNDLLIKVGGNGDQVRVMGWYSARFAAKAMDRIVFADGTTLSGDRLEQAIAGTGGGQEQSGDTATGLLRNGSARNDKLKGARGDDTLRGYAGNDTLEGEAGNDLLYGGAGNDKLEGDAGNDKLYGGAGNDKLEGDEGNDLLVGGAGNDVLEGDEGRDTLTGGAGRDVFKFDSGLTKNNADVITDFTRGMDKIHLEDDMFRGLGRGVLRAAHFTANANGRALDRNDRIIYNTKTGALLYDADGKGGAAAVQFATLQNKPNNLAASDFLVVD